MKKMEKVFLQYHEPGQGGLLRSPGVIKGLTNLLIKKFPGDTYNNIN